MGDANPQAKASPDAGARRSIAGGAGGSAGLRWRARARDGGAGRARDGAGA